MVSRHVLRGHYSLNVPVQALALMAAFKDEWPCLIIVPSSLRGDFSGSSPSTLLRWAAMRLFFWGTLLLSAS